MKHKYDKKEYIINLLKKIKILFWKMMNLIKA